MAKSATRAKTKYNEKSYDRVYIRVKKGRGDEMRKHAERAGMSLAAFVDTATIEKAERDGLLDDPNE